MVDEPVAGDVTKPLWGFEESTLSELAGEVDAVVNLAGETNWAAPRGSLYRANVLGAVNGFDVAARLRALGGRCAAYVYASSIHVAGSLTGRVPERPLPPDGSRTAYEQSKWLAEQALLDRAAAGEGPPVVIARVGGLVGNSVSGRTARRNSLYMLPTLWNRLPGRVMPYVPAGRVDMLPRDDAARMIAELARVATEQPLGPAEVVHVCAGEDAPTIQALLAAVRSLRAREPDDMPRLLPGPQRFGAAAVDLYRRLQRPAPEWHNALAGLRYISIDRQFERARLAALVRAPLPSPPIELLARLVFGEAPAPPTALEAAVHERDGAFARFAG